jgi:hypothetical protein
MLVSGVSVVAVAVFVSNNVVADVDDNVPFIDGVLVVDVVPVVDDTLVVVGVSDIAMMFSVLVSFVVVSGFVIGFVLLLSSPVGLDTVS